MARNCHSGHPLKWFKDQNAARHAYECAICLEVLEDPVQVRDCGHQFCALCIDDTLKTDPRCPSCRIEISKSMVFEDHAARRLINQLDVNCCNEGCNWQGCLSSLLQDHQNSCNFLIGSGGNVHQFNVRKLEQKLETLMVKVSTLEKKHEEDIKEIKLKHENELKAIKAKYQNDLKQVQAVQENKLKQFKTKHEQEVKQFKTKYDEDVKRLGQKIEVLQAIGAAHAPLATQFPHRCLPEQEPEADYTLKIANFTRKLAQAKSGNNYGTIESEPFFSSHGYKMKLVVDLNEAPSGYAGYMGVYLVLMKSDRDGTLAWPFTKNCTFVLVDQQDDLDERVNIKLVMGPNGEEEFRKPRQRENMARGWSQFVKHSTLRTRQYILDHTVYIKILIDQ